jgi:hypothetical protein
VGLVSVPAVSPVANSAVTLRRLDVALPTLVIEGHTLSDVSLSGWAYGPELGTAPVAIVVGRNHGVAVPPR